MTQAQAQAQAVLGLMMIGIIVLLAIFATVLAHVRRHWNG